MRAAMGTGNIGRSLDLAVVAGIPEPIGPVRKYDPVNPCDVEQGGVIPPVPAQLPSSFVESLLTQVQEAMLPMSSHQRLWRWPDDGVGPVRCDPFWGKSKPPVEVPAGQSEWPVPVVPLQMIEAVELPPFPDIDTLAVETQAVAPVRGMSLRPDWTVTKEGGWKRTPNLLVGLSGDSKQFTITGVTRDKDGVALPACRVIAFDQNALAKGYPCIVGETISDGSGNYSIVASGRPSFLVAYLPGSPDRSGATKNDVIGT